MIPPSKSVPFEKVYAGGTTPVPNDLLDRIMPTLRDTELRLLLVVVRQTLGWQDGPTSSQRKERDWLTQSQLMRRTGRASEAVARAIDALLRGNLIDVLDRKGRPLITASERRRHLGQLYYRLHPGAIGENAVCRQPKSEQAKPNITKETQYKNKNADNKIVDKPFVIRNNRWTLASKVGISAGRKL